MQSFEIPNYGTMEAMSDAAAVALPGSELYEKHIKRWSKAAEKLAVSIPLDLSISNHLGHKADGF